MGQPPKGRGTRCACLNHDPSFTFIEGQEEHHRVVSFQEEYRKFLKEYEVEYDERYVWD